MLGLVTVRYFARLLPLLLGWLHSPDRATSFKSLEVLQSILQNTWPRVSVHAPLLWQHIVALYFASIEDAGQAVSQTSGLCKAEHAFAEMVVASDESRLMTSRSSDCMTEALVFTGVLLYWSGSKRFRQHVESHSVSPGLVQKAPLNPRDV